MPPTMHSSSDQLSRSRKRAVVGRLPVTGRNTIPSVQLDRVPRYEIGWSAEYGWRAEVAIHTSIMFRDDLTMVFENCDTPEHAFALANQWVNETLQSLANETKSAAVAAGGSL